MKVRVDAEFRELIPPLSGDERAQLEANLKRDGCRDPLVTWNGTLLDGHNRYQFCTSERIKFSTVEVSGINDRDDAKCWIIRNQFGRRNLEPFVRCELSFGLDEIEKAKAKERQKTSTGGKRPQLVLNSDQAGGKGRTNMKLAKIAGVGHDTIHKARIIKNEASEDVKEKLRRGETSINAEHKKLRPTGREPGKKPRKDAGKKKSVTYSATSKQLEEIANRVEELKKLTKGSSNFWDAIGVQLK